MAEEQKKDLRSLQQRDHDLWKKAKKAKQDLKDAARLATKKMGHRLGRWTGGSARCKADGCQLFARYGGLVMGDVVEMDATKHPCKGGR